MAFQKISFGLAGNFTIFDSCWKENLQDLHCHCTATYCASKTLYVVQEYRKRNLNLGKNLAAYYNWYSANGQNFKPSHLFDGLQWTAVKLAKYPLHRIDSSKEFRVACKYL